MLQNIRLQNIRFQSTRLHRLTVIPLLSGLMLSGCMTHSSQPQSESTQSHPPATHAANLSVCHAIYDAGSSGTRLYLYQQHPDNPQHWISHSGPKVSALADPVREIRGKRWQDADSVTTEVAQALEQIRQDGPAKSNGKPEWSGFDWRQQCDLQSARVLATAGMRIAEQEDRVRSQKLWQMLKGKLQVVAGPQASVDTRTLTGFEEGLYAWLALQDEHKDNAYGIAEMGGASSQVTFPCPDCNDQQDAVRTVKVDGQPIRIYSYSFLGLGQDEATETLAFPDSCQWGVGEKVPGWTPTACASQIPLTTSQDLLKDPYNYPLAAVEGQTQTQKSAKGTANRPPLELGSQQHWYLTGAFSFMQPDDIDNCCFNAGFSCYNPQTSCFTSVYRPTYLTTLGIPVNSDQADVSWTEGANLCGATQCLSLSQPPVCRWSDQGCLD